MNILHKEDLTRSDKLALKKLEIKLKSLRRQEKIVYYTGETISYYMSVLNRSKLKLAMEAYEKNCAVLVQKKHYNGDGDKVIGIKVFTVDSEV